MRHVVCVCFSRSGFFSPLLAPRSVRNRAQVGRQRQLRSIRELGAYASCQMLALARHHSGCCTPEAEEAAEAAAVAAAALGKLVRNFLFMSLIGAANVCICLLACLAQCSLLCLMRCDHRTQSSQRVSQRVSQLDMDRHKQIAYNTGASSTTTTSTE